MSGLTPLLALKWTQVHSKTLFWWGPGLNRHGVCTLRLRANGCLVSSFECWPLSGQITWNSSYPGHHGLGCVPVVYKTFAVHRWWWLFKVLACCFLLCWLIFAEVFCLWFFGAHFWELFVLVRYCPTHKFKMTETCFFRHVAAKFQCNLIIETPVQ